MHVLVTGGSSGIGAATAVAFGGIGARVTLTYHQGAERAAEVVRRVEKAGGTAQAVHLDLADHAGIRATVARTGPFDALIANAVRWGGTGPVLEPFEQVPATEWTAALHANLVGNVVLAQAVLPGMREKRFGRIVLVSSGVAEEGVPGTGPYGSAKMALHGLVRNLAWSGGGDGILANVVAAGLTVTERERPFPEEALHAVAARTPSRRLSTAEDVAALLLFLGSAANRNVTGEIVRDGSSAGRSAHV
jgi:NAD(P)-dependent dehydrogenase (short-subunit alcohol dehydrogenase family)